MDVSRLFGFAADRVPELAIGVGGIQRPVIACPRGSSFDIGRLTEPDRAKVPLLPVRPMFLRSNFQDEDEIEDVLELAKLIDGALLDESQHDRGAALVFVDVRAFPGAHRLAGRYRVEGDDVTVDVRLRLGREIVATFTARGLRGDLVSLGNQIVAEARRRVE